MVFVVYDLEYTAWEDSWACGWSEPGKHREIVQIGAVRLSPGLDECSALEVLVCPRINPMLSDYFIALTGITQARVDTEGVDIAEALEQFAAFAGNDVLLSNGRDDVVIAEQCRLEGLPMPLPGQYRDVSAALATALDSREHIVSADLPTRLGLPSVGHNHNALDDARSVVTAIVYLTRARRLDLDRFKKD